MRLSISSQLAIARWNCPLNKNACALLANCDPMLIMSFTARKVQTTRTAPSRTFGDLITMTARLSSPDCASRLSVMMVRQTNHTCSCDWLTIACRDGRLHEGSLNTTSNAPSKTSLIQTCRKSPRYENQVLKAHLLPTPPTLVNPTNTAPNSSHTDRW